MNTIKIWIFIAALTVTCSAYANEDHDHDQEEKNAVVSNAESKKHAETEHGHDDDQDAHGEEKGHDENEEEHGHGDESHGDESHGDEHEEGGDDGHGHGEAEAASSDAELNDEQRRMAGIETMAVKVSAVGEVITAPGEVMLNAYRTTNVTPRVAAQVTQRHVRLGDHVSKGQPLVTLSSVDMAEAQGVLLGADVEWRRVKKLGRKVVSEKRYVSAQISHQQAMARVRAFGMTSRQINALLKSGDASKAIGEFKLLAVQDGTVISDDFVVGELIEPGHLLFKISDESLLWVEARLTPHDSSNVSLGADARIKAGDTWLMGKVAQARHTLDETTRTLAVHIEVPNPNDQLHPGQFVTAIIEAGDKQVGMAVPLAAVMRSPDGDWQVFVEVAAGRFEPKEIEVLRTVGDRMVIEGLDEGTMIVSKGAFFVQSEIAKSGFEIHNH